VFLCVVGAMTLVVLMLFVIPRFTSLFATMGEQLPLPTRLLLAFSHTVEHFWPVVLGSIVAAVVGCVLLARQESVRIFLDRWLLFVPYVGQIIRRSEIARFARTLSELLTSGVPILTALQITRGVMTNRSYAVAIEEVRQGVSKGTPIAALLGKQAIFTPLVVNMASVGEQSGQLSELLMEVADIYEKECERAIQAFTTILGPTLIVVLGGVIAFVITAILLPVFQAGTLVD
jgi:general secretion pathway protein F